MIIFFKNWPKKEQKNAGHTVTDEIGNGSSENIGYNIKKEAVSALKRKIESC